MMKIPSSVRSIVKIASPVMALAQEERIAVEAAPNFPSQ